MMEEIRRIDEIKEETLLVIKVLRGAGTPNSVLRHVIQYFKRNDDGSYILLFENDPCKQKE